MNAFLRRMLGQHPMNEAGADAGVSAPVAAAPVAAPAAAPAAAPVPAGAPGTLLTDAAPAPATDAPAADPAAPVVPETYAFETPEGFELDEEVMGEFTGLAKELGLTQEKASALVGLQTKLMQKIDAARAEQLDAALVEQSQRWADEVRNDPTFGGQNFDATVATAAKAMQAFGSPELRAMLNDSGLGNHPEVVKLFHRIGTGLTEDKLVLPGGQVDSSAEKDPAKVLWPNAN